ncbi:MAG: DUF4191 family protein [Streptosporangiales bacterium]|nr:DUF4191 family protein [Streptosporangiales bacterium]
MAKKPTDTSEDRPGRIKQLRMVARVVHQNNPKALPLAALVGVAVLAVFVVVGVLTGDLWLWLPPGIMIGFLAGFVLFSRSAQSIQYKMLEGQTGAAAAILENMRGNWQVAPAVAVNRNMDIVHRVVGRPGVVLVGEGSPHGLAPLLAAEKKRVARVAEVLIYDLQVGNGEGQVPLNKLQNKVMKLPRNLKKPAVAELTYRLKALPSGPQMPKGPMPKGMRMPKGPKPRMR